MPLIKSPSKQAQSANIKREMAAGKPQKQAVAISFAVKKKAGGTDYFKKAKSAAITAKAAPMRTKKPKTHAFA